MAGSETRHPLASTLAQRWRKLHFGVDADTHKIVAVEVTPDDVGDVSTCLACLIRSIPRLLYSPRTARMMAGSSTMLSSTAILTPGSSFRCERRRLQMRLQRRSEIGILQRSKRMDAWVGSADLVTTAVAWSRLR